MQITHTKRKRTHFCIGAGVLTALVVSAYLPAFRGGFIWDDDFWVHQNPLVTGRESIWKVWYTAAVPGQNYPLTYTLFRAQWLLWGSNPFGYHLLNILLHAANAILLWAILKTLRLPGAWWVAAVFGLHPLMVESVAWITEAKNTSSTFFLALSLAFFLRFERARGRGAYVASLALYLLALLSKTYFCTFPAILFLLGWWRGKITRGYLKSLLPYLFLSISAGVFTWWYEVWHVGVRGEDWAIPFWGRPLIAGRAFWFYLGKLLLPVRLTFIYPRRPPDPGDLFSWIVPLLAAGFLWFAWLIRRRAGRGLFTAFACYLVILSPSLGFIDFYAQIYSYVADHYAYLAVIGPIAAAAAFFRNRLSFRRAAVVPAAAILVLYGALSFRQGWVYRDLETLWRETIKRNPEAGMAYNNLGVLLLNDGRAEEAIPHFRKALAIDPRNAFAHNNLGTALAALERPVEALGPFEAAIRLRPGKSEFYCGLASALEKTGRPQAAMDTYQRALELKSDLAEAYLGRGRILDRLGKTEEALDCFQMLVQVDPGNAEAYNEMGMVLVRLGRKEEAVRMCREALRRRPEAKEAYANLMNALAEKGEVGEAIEFYRAFLEEEPDDPRVRYNLGVALRKAGKREEAVAAFRETIRTDPKHMGAYLNLAGILYDDGRRAEARELLEQAVAADPRYAKARYNLAIILFEEGKLEEANKQLERALTDQPDLAPARALLDLVQKKLSGSAAESGERN